jgi:hypothetical protein
VTTSPCLPHLPWRGSPKCTSVDVIMPARERRRERRRERGSEGACLRLYSALLFWCFVCWNQTHHRALRHHHKVCQSLTAFCRWRAARQYLLRGDGEPTAARLKTHAIAIPNYRDDIAFEKGGADRWPVPVHFAQPELGKHFDDDDDDGTIINKRHHHHHQKPRIPPRHCAVTTCCCCCAGWLAGWFSYDRHTTRRSHCTLHS